MYFSIHCGTIVAALVTIVTVTIYNNTVYKGSNLDVRHRWMDKVAMVLHTMECYSVINRRYWISCTEVDEPRAYHAEWSKSERENKYHTLLFCHSVMSNPLRPCWLQNASLPCPSPPPGACSNSSPSSQWWYPTISSSVTHFFFCLQSFPELGAFPMSWLFTSSG